MIKSLAVLLVLGAAIAAVLPVAAQTSAAMPTCAAGDPVVWENTNTKAYHLAGDSFYGKTKHGAYACKSAAASGGYHLAGQKHAVTPNSASTSAPMMASPDPAASGSMSAMHHHGKHHHGSAIASPTPAPAAT